MEDFNFHQYHLSLFVIRIMKKIKQSADFDHLCLSDSTAISCINSAHWLLVNSFLMLKYPKPSLLVFKLPLTATILFLG